MNKLICTLAIFSSFSVFSFSSNITSAKVNVIYTCNHNYDDLNEISTDVSRINAMELTLENDHIIQIPGSNDDVVVFNQNVILSNKNIGTIVNEQKAPKSFIDSCINDRSIVRDIKVQYDIDLFDSLKATSRNGIKGICEVRPLMKTRIGNFSGKQTTRDDLIISNSESEDIRIKSINQKVESCTTVVSTVNGTISVVVMGAHILKKIISNN